MGYRYGRKSGNPMMLVLAVFLIAIIIVGSLVAANYLGVLPWNSKSPPPAQCTNGSSNYPLCNNNVPPPPPIAGIYSGTVSFLVNEYWAKDGSGLAFTSAVVNIYHADGLTIAGVPTIGGASGAGTATSIVESSTDNGVMVMGYLAAKNTVSFLDPVYTLSRNQGNKGGLKSISYSLDPNNDGLYDIEFTMDLSGFSNTNPNLTPSVTINLYGWKVTTSNLSITASSSPTGMTTAGTYTASGYVSTSDGNGYEAKVMKWTLWASHDDAANTTASSFETLIQAGTVTLTGIALWGVGATSQAKYGASWGSVYSTLGVPNYPIPSFDVTNTKWVLFQANQPTSSTSFSQGSGINGASFDVSQIEWGMPIIYEVNSATNFFAYNIQFKTTASAMTASSKYYIFLEGIAASGTASSDQSSDNLELKITLTG